MLRFALALLAAVWATPTHAQGLVTVHPEPRGEAWWLRAEFHALHRQVRGIPVKAIRADWCKATEFTRGLFPPELLVENGVDLLADSGLAFSREGTFDGSGTRQLALVGTYETCRGRKGRFLLILDAGTRKVRFLHAEAANQRFSALAVGKDSALHVFYCMECDISARVVWDRGRKRFVLR